MKLKCVDNTDLEELLTIGKQYSGEIHKSKPSNMSWSNVKIFLCDDKKPGFFRLNRFEEVFNDTDSILWGEPEVKINSYTLETERK